MVPYSSRATYPVQWSIAAVWFALITFSALMVGFAVIGVSCVLGAEPARPTPQPTVILTPSTLPIYAHPSPSPSGPMTILPPAAPPIYVHPSPSSYGPATVIVPGDLPTFIWPGVSE